MEICNVCHKSPCAGVNCPSVHNISGGGGIGYCFPPMHSDDVRNFEHFDVGSGAVTRNYLLDEEVE